jgi:hypothetical protein
LIKGRNNNTTTNNNNNNKAKCIPGGPLRVLAGKNPISFLKIQIIFKISKCFKIVLMFHHHVKQDLTNLNMSEHV